MASPPSPTQLALYGEVANVIRKAMERKGMKVTTLNSALGYRPSNPTAYYWLNAKSAPSPATRPRLAKILNIDPSSLIPKDEPQMPTKVSKTTASPVNGTDVLSPTQAIGLSILSDGTAELKFNLTLPAKEALRLLVTLTDEGLIAYPKPESETTPNDKPTEQSV